MNLREKLEQLVAVDTLPADEKEVYTFVLTIMGDGTGEGMLDDDVESQYLARYEWYFDPKGNRRKAAC